jgi:hypothetical protein
LINEKLNYADEINKQWKHFNVLYHPTSFLFYSEDTEYQMKPVDEWGEKVKIVVGYYKFNISTTTHWFQIIILAFGRSISLDALQYLIIAI